MVTTKLGSECHHAPVTPKTREPSPMEIKAREIPPEKVGEFMVTFFECTKCGLPCNVIPLDGEYAGES